MHLIADLFALLKDPGPFIAAGSVYLVVLSLAHLLVPRIAPIDPARLERAGA